MWAGAASCWINIWLLFLDKNGTLMMATLHPAALLRNPGQKPAAFEDYLKLREKIDELGCDVAKR